MKRIRNAVLVPAVLLMGMVASSRADIVISTLYPRSVDYHQFTSTGGAASFNIRAGVLYTEGPTGRGLIDSAIYLAVDDGSPIGALTGAIVGYNNNSVEPGWNADGSYSPLDSFLTLNLTAGNYILGVGRNILSVNEFRSGNANSPTVSRDYQLTFDGVSPLSAVPEPSTLAMGAFCLALAGLTASRRRHGAAG